MPNIPTAPSIVLPDSPSLSEIVLPAPPSITLPLFDAQLPEEIMRTPDGFSWEESPYNSEVWSNLLAKVQDGLVNGGTGLGPDVEGAIWDRARSRQAAENDKLFQKIRDSYVGYSMAPNALASAEAEAFRHISRNNRDLNSDIAIKQAELAKEHSQFILEKGLSLEEVLRSFHNAQANRSFEVAKAVAKNSIEIVNVLISRYNSKLERYKAEASVYESKVKAALAEVDVFKSMVEASKVSSEVQKNLVDIYGKQIDAIKTHVQLYSAQMENVKVAADIEKTKLEAFQLETQAYIARMSAEKVKFDIYQAETEAEKAKAQTFAEQVRAFVAQVDAKKAESSLKMINLDSVLKENAMKIEEYRGELTGYSAAIDATSKKVGAVVEGFKAEVSAYSAETIATGSMYDAKIKEISARIEEAKFKLQKSVAEVDARTKGYIAVKSLQVKGTEGIMNVGAQLSASAMNAVNASASLSSSMSESFGEHYSSNQSLSESHYFEEKKGLRNRHVEEEKTTVVYLVAFPADIISRTK